jgi:urocanate hydratase
MADRHFGGSLRGTVTVTAGLGGMSGAQPLAVTMNDGVCLVIEPIDERVKQKVREGYVDEQARDLTHALELCERAKADGKGWSVGLTGNAATVLPQLLELGFQAEIVTDQTSAHDLMDYIPEGEIGEVLALREANPEEFKRQALASIVKHVEAILEMQRRGTIAVDYGNNLRGQAEKGGLNVRDEAGQFLYPGFVPAYIRPLFCEGKGPFRWVALSGDQQDILRIDRALLETFPENKLLARWIEKAQAKVPCIGLPARVCWLGYGEREQFGLVINDLVARGEVSAPIVIGRDHLDCGSVASPNRETEGMKDGSDAVADWPLLNALANCASGADWVSLHNGGGVGIGNSTHSGMVIVATGTPEKAERLRRVLTTDPGMGIFRHADAGYELAQDVARERGAKIPGLSEKA